VLVLLASLLACTSPEPPPAGVELGTGDLDFEPLLDGQDVYVVQGPQGGYHILGSARLAGVDAGDPDDLASSHNPHTVFQVVARGAQLAPAASYVQGYDPVPDAYMLYEMVGRLVILDISSDAELDQVPITLSVSVSTADGYELSDQLDLVAVPHPSNL